MIKVHIPNNNIEERCYIIDVIFQEFLGLDLAIEIGSEDYEIILPNGNKLVIRDGFFNQYSGELEYLDESNIPSQVDKLDLPHIEQKGTPILFGSNTFDIEGERTVWGVDIFATCFFMLTRWEEHVVSTHDKHNRARTEDCLAFKFGFKNRPIVNEYVQILRGILVNLGLECPNPDRKFEVVLTHDIDDFRLFKGIKVLLRRLVGDIIVRKNPLQFALTFGKFLTTKLNLTKDPFDTFESMMTLAERCNLKSHFFFMAKGKTRYDNRYNSDNIDVKNTVKSIKDRGHYVGIHPSYDSYINLEQFRKEKDELETNFNSKINIGRQHYLRFDIAKTWSIWNSHGMRWDSTVGFSDTVGFRAGVCYEYTTFDILNRNKLELKERPLILMDSALVECNIDQIREEITEVVNQVQKYNGSLVLLWHNCSPFLLTPTINNLMKSLIKTTSN